MKLSDADLRYCSRDFLEAAEDSVSRSVATGCEHLRSRLEAIRSAIKEAPDYSLERQTVDGWE